MIFWDIDRWDGLVYVFFVWVDGRWWFEDIYLRVLFEVGMFFLIKKKLKGVCWYLKVESIWKNVIVFGKIKFIK